MKIIFDLTFDFIPTHTIIYVSRIQSPQSRQNEKHPLVGSILVSMESIEHILVKHKPSLQNQHMAGEWL